MAVSVIVLLAFLALLCLVLPGSGKTPPAKDRGRASGHRPIEGRPDRRVAARAAGRSRPGGRPLLRRRRCAVMHHGPQGPERRSTSRWALCAFENHSIYADVLLVDAEGRVRRALPSATVRFIRKRPRPWPPHCVIASRCSRNCTPTATSRGPKSTFSRRFPVATGKPPSRSGR